MRKWISYFPKSKIFRVWEIGLAKAAYMLVYKIKKNLVLTKFFNYNQSNKFNGSSTNHQSSWDQSKASPCTYTIQISQIKRDDWTMWTDEASGMYRSYLSIAEEGTSSRDRFSAKSNFVTHKPPSQVKYLNSLHKRHWVLCI